MNFHFAVAQQALCISETGERGAVSQLWVTLRLPKSRGVLPPRL